jgi:hypothetical protein
VLPAVGCTELRAFSVCVTEFVVNDTEMARFILRLLTHTHTVIMSRNGGGWLSRVVAVKKERVKRTVYSNAAPVAVVWESVAAGLEGGPVTVRDVIKAGDRMHG